MAFDNRSDGERMQAGDLDRGYAGDYIDPSMSGIWLCTRCGEDEFSAQMSTKDPSMCTECAGNLGDRMFDVDV